MKLYLQRFAARRRSLAFALCAGLVAVSGGCAADVDLAAVPEAADGCEPPTPEELVPEPPMLPGRHCLACHTESGQASRRIWTAAGTVFDSPTAACNSGGMADVKVEILDTRQDNRVLITLYTNRTGNFFTAEPIDFSSITARVSKNGLTRQMVGNMPSADCPACHRPGGFAGGRIYLN
jgi:hypothetical protein